MLDWSLASLFAVLSGTSSIAARFFTVPRHTLAARLGANGFAVLHYLMIGQAAGLVGNILSAIRNAAGAFLPRKPMILLTWTSVVALAAMVATLDLNSVFALLSFISMAISNHYRDKPVAFYSLFALGEALWLAYGISVGSGLVLFYTISTLLILLVPLRKAIIADRAAKLTN